MELLLKTCSIGAHIPIQDRPPDANIAMILLRSQVRRLFAYNLMRRPVFADAEYLLAARLTNNDTVSNNLFWIGLRLVFGPVLKLSSTVTEL